MKNKIRFGDVAENEIRSGDVAENETLMSMKQTISFLAFIYTQRPVFDRL